MNAVDIGIIILLAYGAWKGFKFGLIIELFTLLALVVGLYFAIYFSDYASDKLKADFELDSLYVSPLAFLLTFLAVGAVIFFLGKTLEKVVKITALSPLNKLLGVLFSCLKVVYILSAAFILLEGYNERRSEKILEMTDESILYPTVIAIGKNSIPGIKNSSMYIQNALKNESQETGLSPEAIVKTKEVADSLNVVVEDAKEIKRLHDTYVK